MGKVTVTARVENVGDLFAVEQGTLSRSAVRAIEVADALVDTGASGLSMPKAMLDQLGLIYLSTRQARTATGTVAVRMFGTARLTVQGRDCPCDVTEVADDCPVLIGQLPLEAMDFVVDPSAQRVIGNPGSWWRTGDRTVLKV